jgi:hypothetical protein
MTGKRIRKAVRRRVGRVISKGKQLVSKAMKDSLVREYVRGQKKLARSALKKAIKRVEKRI